MKQESFIPKEHLNEPGPGAYYNAYTYSTFKVHTKPTGFQFFNSKDERFKNKHNFVPGPGYYESAVQLHQEKKEDKMFVYHEKRFKPAETKKFGPGPGFYDMPNTLKEPKNTANIELMDCPPIFGSGMRRFTQRQPTTDVIFNRLILN